MPIWTYVLNGQTPEFKIKPQRPQILRQSKPKIQRQSKPESQRQPKPESQRQPKPENQRQRKQKLPDSATEPEPVPVIDSDLPPGVIKTKRKSPKMPKVVEEPQTCGDCGQTVANKKNLIDHGKACQFKQEIIGWYCVICRSKLSRDDRIDHYKNSHPDVTVYRDIIDNGEDFIRQARENNEAAGHHISVIGSKSKLCSTYICSAAQPEQKVRADPDCPNRRTPRDKIRKGIVCPYFVRVLQMPNGRYIAEYCEQHNEPAVLITNKKNLPKNLPIVKNTLPLDTNIFSSDMPAVIVDDYETPSTSKPRGTTVNYRAKAAEFAMVQADVEKLGRHISTMTMKEILALRVMTMKLVEKGERKKNSRKRKREEWL